MEECFFSKVAGFATLLKVALLHGCFSRFLNCTNGTKSRKASHMHVALVSGTSRPGPLQTSELKSFATVGNS